MPRIFWPALLCASFLFTLLRAHNITEESNEPSVEIFDSRPVNILFINNEENAIANRSVTNALNAINEQYPGRLGKVYMVQINSSDSRSTVERICSAWYDSLQSGSKNSPDFVLDTTTTGKGAEMVEMITAALSVPTLSAQFGQSGDLRNWRYLSNDQVQYLIQVTPPTDLIPEAIRQLAMSMNISNAAILFDEEFVMDHKYKSLLLNVHTRHVIMKIKTSTESVKSQLKKLRELDIVNYFVLGNQATIALSLEAAQALNFTGRKYAWYTLTADEEKPQCSKCKNITVLSFLPRILTNSYKRKWYDTKGKEVLLKPLLVSAFYYDLTRLGVLAMKNALGKGDWPTRPRHVTCDSYYSAYGDDRFSETPSRKFDFLSHLKKASNSNELNTFFDGFLWGEKNGFHRPKFDMILNLFSIVDGDIYSEKKVGDWLAAGVDSPIQVDNANTVSNHTALTSYRVVTKIHPPFVIYDNKTNSYSGYCIDLLISIQKELNFIYEIYQVEDDEYGSMDDDGNWNGMIKDLIEKKADVALGTLSVMAEREVVIDYTVPIYDLVGLSIIMLKPQSPTSLFKFLTVLENEVWFSILGAYFFTGFLMWVFDRWSPYSYQNNREKYKDDVENREFTLKECLWFCMTSLTPQGGGEAPKNLSGRLIAATWWLFGFIIIASYTANLAAFLTVSRLDTPIESLDDLSKQYKIQYATVDNSLAFQYFDRMANIETRFYELWKDMSMDDNLSVMEKSKLAVWDYPVSDKYTKLFQSMKDAGFPKNQEEALERVRSSGGQFAYIDDASWIKYWVKTNCDLQMVGEEFSRKPYSIAVQQNSPLKDQLNNAILTLLNRRELERLKDKWWDIEKQCEKEDDQSGGISIRNIGGVFIVIFVGIGLACVTLVFEYYYYRNRPMVQNFPRHGRSQNLGQNTRQIRFNLRPAPTHSLRQTSQFQSKF